VANNVDSGGHLSALMLQSYLDGNPLRDEL